MKIAVIDASGRKGRSIISEALSRGCSVTGFVLRDSEEVPAGIDVLKKSAFYITSKDLYGFDAIIDAFEQDDPEKDFQYTSVVMTLADAIKTIPGSRLIVSGGIESTCADASGNSGQSPSSVRSRYDALKILKSGNINWTYLCISGTAEYPENPSGADSSEGAADLNISVGDVDIDYQKYAAAIIDELEKREHEKQIFSIACDAKQKNVDSLPDHDYLPPANLKDTALHIIMDSGKEGTLVFLTGEILLWAPIGESAEKLYYKCRKIESDTFLICSEYTKDNTRIGNTLVLDNAQGLVTSISACLTKNNDFDIKNNDIGHDSFRDSFRLKEEIVFGAIKTDGQDLPLQRHRFTSDLVGTSVVWNADDQQTSHIYYDPFYIRMAPPGADDVSRKAERLRRRPFDVKCTYIKIKDGIYLIVYSGDYTDSEGDDSGCQKVFLIDKKAWKAEGRIFGTSKGKNLNTLFSASGTPTEQK